MIARILTITDYCQYVSIDGERWVLNIKPSCIDYRNQRQNIGRWKNRKHWWISRAQSKLGLVGWCRGKPWKVPTIHLAVKFRNECIRPVCQLQVAQIARPQWKDFKDKFSDELWVKGTGNQSCMSEVQGNLNAEKVRISYSCPSSVGIGWIWLKIIGCRVNKSPSMVVIILLGSFVFFQKCIYNMSIVCYNKYVPDDEHSGVGQW